MHLTYSDELGFFTHPDAEPISEDLDWRTRVWVDAEGEEVDAVGEPLELLLDTPRLVEPVAEGDEIAGVEDACEFVKV
jgi:hypothetical protein